MSAGVDRSPTPTSGRIAVAAAVVAALATGASAPASLALALPSVATLAWGLRRASRDVVSAGALGLFLASLFAGVAGATVGPTLLGAGLAVVAWDVAGNAIELGEQVGRAAPARDAELAHASGTAAVGVGAGGLGYAFYAAAGGGRPMTALVLLTFAALLLASGLRLDPIAADRR